jgi:hypothetical protein
MSNDLRSNYTQRNLECPSCYSYFVHGYLRKRHSLQSLVTYMFSPCKVQSTLHPTIPHLLPLENLSSPPEDIAKSIQPTITARYHPPTPPSLLAIAPRYRHLSAFAHFVNPLLSPFTRPSLIRSSTSHGNDFAAIRAGTAEAQPP